MKIIKTRFSPSPTGNIHLGNTRTALFGLLYAMNRRGHCILRLEDTDQVRSSVYHARLLLDDLKWLGIMQDYVHLRNDSNSLPENPQIMFQSNRTHIYRSYCCELIKKSVAYFCFCTKEELEKKREEQILNKLAPRYTGTCRYLKKKEILEKIRMGLTPTVRYLVPDNKTIRFYDIIRGCLEFNSGNIGDFIILKKDKRPTFLLCNLIDDSLSGVTHIIRGEDHITNTACQEMMASSLSLKRALYLHLSLFLEKDGVPFSKRNESLNIKYLRKNGYLPVAIINYLATSGNIYHNSSPVVLNRLIENTTIKSISRSSTTFDKNQIIQWQKKSVEGLCELDFFLWSGKKVIKTVPKHLRSVFFDAIRENVLFPCDVEFWANCLFSRNFVPDRLFLKDFDLNTSALLKEIEEFLLTDTELNKLVMHIMNVFRLKKKSALMCIRVAITGKTSGPGLKKILQMLDTKNINRRLSCENLR